MTPLRLTRQSAPVEAIHLKSASDLDPAWTWLAEYGFEAEIHGHGLLIYADGLIPVDIGQWITVSANRRVQVWDTAELRGEHDGLEEAS